VNGADTVQLALGKVSDERQKQSCQQTDDQRQDAQTLGTHVIIRTTGNCFKPQKYHCDTCKHSQQQQQQQSVVY